MQDGTSCFDRTLQEKDACLGSRGPKEFPGVGIKDLARERLEDVLHEHQELLCEPLIF